MKILITHVYSRNNNGDAAILACLIRELRRVFENPQLNISTMEQGALGETFEGVSHIPSLINTAIDNKPSSIIRLFSILRCSITVCIWAIIYRISNKRFDKILRREENIFMNNLADADAVIAVGGGYIQSRPGLKKTLDLMLVLQPLWLSHILKKKTILHAQSIGPFGSNYQKWFAGVIIKVMDLVVIRESVTGLLLKKMGVNDEIIEMSADAAFLLAKEEMTGVIPKKLLDIRHSHGGGLIIGVTARSFLKKNAQEKYEHEIAMALDLLVKAYKAHIVFIPQVTVARYDDDDRIVQARIYENMEQKKYATNMDGIYNFNDIRAMYSTLDILIGTRFHSVIFALSAGIPALAIEYEHKTSGIMNDLGLGGWVIHMDKVTKSRLVELFEKLYLQKDAYLATLKCVMPGYIASVEKAADKIYEVISTDMIGSSITRA